MFVSGVLVIIAIFFCFIFFFKQKTAYEMRISDWSSDVCSSDLLLPYARRDADTRFPESPDTPAAGARIGIVGGHHYPAQARCDEQMAACGSTGRIMEARFQCDIGSGPARQFARLHESPSFGVGASSRLGHAPA